jgi:hypothetical protein
MLDIMAFEWTCDTDAEAPGGVKEAIEVYVNDKPTEGKAGLIDKIKETATLLKRGIKERDLDTMMAFHVGYTQLIKDLKPKEAP